MSHNEPDPINYVSVPTLKSISAVRVLTALNISSSVDYGQGDRKSIGRKEFLIYAPFAPEMKEVISMLPLPTSLKADVASLTRPIVLERLKWMRIFKCEECTGSLHWTNEGTVDRKKTVEELIMKDSRHCLERLFLLASEYCIETCFPEIYERLLDMQKVDYLHLPYMNMHNHPLLAYWIHFAKGELHELLHTIQRYYPAYNCNQSLYQNMLTLAVSQFNPIAVKYFWGKLTDDERCSNFAQWLKLALENGRPFLDHGPFGDYKDTNNCSDVLFFFLSKITDGNAQRDIICNNSLNILKSLFYYWPRQRFLLTTLRVMWDYLDENVYVTFMSVVVKEIKEGFDTEKILREIWYASPTHFRKCFIHYVLHSVAKESTDIWCNLLLVKDMDTIHMLLEEMHSDHRKSVPFSIVKNNKLLLVIYTGELNLFEILVQNTLTSKSDVLALKKGVVEEHGEDVCHQWIYDGNLEMVEKFLSWAFISQDQIDEFKSGSFDKTEIVCDLVWKRANFELVDTFLNWCFNSQEEVHEFKKHFALSKYEIDQIGDDDWDIWNPLSVLPYEYCKPGLDTARRIKFECEVVAELIHWCFYSEEDTKKYKGRFVLSKAYLERFRFFVRCFVDEMSEFEILTNELLTIFLPLEEGVIVELKKTLRNTLYLADQGMRTPLIREEHLFRMIDHANDNTGIESRAGGNRK